MCYAIWGRDSSTEGVQIVEDRRFREFFRCSVVVAILVWRRLSHISQILFSGEPKHLLYALPLIKVHPNEEVMYKLIVIKDSKIFRGRVKNLVKDFIEAIADLELDVVSYSFLFCFVFLYIYLNLFFFP